jgi:hypothetical protein
MMLSFGPEIPELNVPPHVFTTGPAISAALPVVFAEAEGGTRARNCRMDEAKLGATNDVL